MAMLTAAVAASTAASLEDPDAGDPEGTDATDLAVMSV